MTVKTVKRTIDGVEVQLTPDEARFNRAQKLFQDHISGERPWQVEKRIDPNTGEIRNTAYFIQSDSRPGKWHRVTLRGCGCEDFRFRNVACSHITAANMLVSHLRGQGQS